MGLTLYGGARSRASMPRWYLEEKGIPYQWIQLDLEAGEHRQPPFTAINPFAKVPALVDDSLRAPGGEPLQLFESGAILLHLADHHGQDFNGTATEVAAQRALATQWILFANATLAVALFVPSNREREFPRLMTVLDGLLAEERSLLAGPWGNPTWTVADCAVNAYLAYLPIFFPQVDLSAYPNVQATIAATQARPAYRRVMGLA
ncbi:glutathione S-transferase [Cyanobium sp. Alchichica 3B3-8F6]|uniref:glutathione S-transferase family protein n=1 Tax=Cyanobium sp. Alchichica 3B3-8F6 TaxID=2823696 RepID=UPI0020CEFAC4|nr:glutathione S-transferase [Cyanobium sp. Alchichica 3B3-8F6]MCP9880979.1 glutathione S-transferase [Cyanobium sp. Alchichica 3B3-8F6]